MFSARSTRFFYCRYNFLVLQSRTEFIILYTFCKSEFIFLFAFLLYLRGIVCLWPWCVLRYKHAGCFLYIYRRFYREVNFIIVNNNDAGRWVIFSLLNL